jgi:hypothetical protein
MIDTGWHCDLTVIIGELDCVRVAPDDIVGVQQPPPLHDLGACGRSYVSHYKWNSAAELRGRSSNVPRIKDNASVTVHVPHRSRSEAAYGSPESRSKSASTAAISFCRRGSCDASVAARRLRR